MTICYILCSFGTFCVHLVHFVFIWYILCSFGTFCVHLVHFVFIWYILRSFATFCVHLVHFFPFRYHVDTKKNLATLCTASLRGGPANSCCTTGRKILRHLPRQGSGQEMLA
jgi:hypothetical protein